MDDGEYKPIYQFGVDISPMPEPRMYNRGLIIPVDVYNLVIKEELSVIEAWLLAVIDSHVNSKGDGCWATNENLAKLVQVEVRQLQYMVKKLKDLGFLRQVGWKKIHGRNFRLLETSWSRVVRYTGAENCTPPVQKTAPRCLSSHSAPKDLLNDTLPRAGEGVVQNHKHNHIHVTVSDLFPTKKKIHPFDHAAAAQLRKAVVQYAASNKKYNLTNWAEEFRLLRHEYGDDQDRIERVLDWYCAHIGGYRVPQAFGAESFRSKFLQIEAAMQRDLEANPQVEISEEATKILGHLSGLTWPKGSKDDVPLVIQLNLDHMRAFRDKLVTAQGDSKKYANHIVACIGSVNAFVLDWMREVYERVVDWEEWSGNLKAYVLSPDSKALARKIKGWLTDYSLNPEKAYTDLMEAL